MESVRQRLNALRSKSAEYEKLCGKHELAEAELNSILKHLSQTSYGVLEEKFNSMSTERDEAVRQHEEMQKEQQDKWELYLELKDREIELTQERENRLGQIEKAVSEAKQDVARKVKASREVSFVCYVVSLSVCLLTFLAVSFLTFPENNSSYRLSPGGRLCL